MYAGIALEFHSLLVAIPLDKRASVPSFLSFLERSRQLFPLLCLLGHW